MPINNKTSIKASRYMKNLIITLLAISILAGISSCSKNMDSPPTGGTDPNITVNFSLDSLKARYNGNPYLITQDLVISGVVVGDDSSGTFYKGIDIEDSTSGIMVMIDSKYLYNLYPMGTRVFVKLKGLYLVQSKGVFEIVAILNSGGTYTGIPSSVVSQFITPGKWGIHVEPKHISLTDLNASPDQYQSELVQIDNVQFAAVFQGTPYYVAGNYGNSTIRDCGGENTYTVYTSAYTDFGNLTVPSGNGTFIGIASVYVSATSGRATYELLVRSPSDLSLTGTLCP
jgi:Family of unknown function (DUF5689)